MIEEKIKSMIKNDIDICKNALTSREGSQNLYLELVVKYSTIDKSFDNNIKVSGKASFDGIFDYRPEIRQIKSKLETYILLDEIPVNYNENVAQNATINMTAKTIKNKGNIGTNNSQNKNKLTNENGKKTINWFKNLFTFRRKK